jgi:hypothetical protein
MRFPKFSCSRAKKKGKFGVIKETWGWEEKFSS